MSESEKALRDGFAMAALTGLLANPEMVTAEDFDVVANTYADLSYLYADAMMRRRGS